MKFIKLTSVNKELKNEKPCYVNMELVTHIEWNYDYKYTLLYSGDVTKVYVKETPEEIFERIERAK